jgi:hypothetical protein
VSLITVIYVSAGREIRTPEVRDHWISNPTPYRAGPSPHPEWKRINQTDKKVMSKAYALTSLFKKSKKYEKEEDKTH